MTAAGALTTLVSFDYVNGANPQGALVWSNGNLYGTTVSGGASGMGTVFRVTPGGELTTLVSFNPGAGFPAAGLLAASNLFYGTTTYGGPSNFGTVFAISSAGTLSLQVPFASANDANPGGVLLLAADTNFYGTSFGGGTGSNASNGAVFRMTPAGVITNVVSFTITNGSHPLGGLVQGSDTNLYGTTSQAGQTDTGTIFKLTLFTTNATSMTNSMPTNTLIPTNTFVPLAPFIYGTYAGGAFPEGPLAQGAGTNFYGTTVEGGLENFGTIFMVSTSGVLTTVFSFAYTNGSGPESGLILGQDGNFYGTTSSGGSYGYGTVFQFVPTSLTLNTLVTFDGTNNGAEPQGPLLQRLDGTFFGTTQSGGPFGYGTVFCVAPISNSWAFTNCAAFNGTNGAYPNGGLAPGSNGDIYGTTSQGGAGGAGTVFRLPSFPALNCQRTGANQLVLSWSTNLGGLILQSSSDLTNWVASAAPSVAGSLYVVTNSIGNHAGSNEFFRLVGAAP